MSIGLSVSWNAFRYEDAEAMLAEVLALGFKEIELSFNLTVSQVEVIAAYLGPHGISVRSLHNYCPIPDGLARKLHCQTVILYLHLMKKSALWQCVLLKGLLILPNDCLLRQ